MKKIYSLFLIFILIGCTTSQLIDENPEFKNAAKEFNSKTTTNKLLMIQDSLLKVYSQNSIHNNQNFNEVIIRLDSITLTNSEFQNLKINNYSIPTTIEIETLINNKNYIYDNLNVSLKCKEILDLIINSEINIDELNNSIITNNINSFETELIQYVTLNLKDHNDPEWKKGKTVFIVKGYLDQPASAVFNACLFEIIN